MGGRLDQCQVKVKKLKLVNEGVAALKALLS
jgi:hypothetical protein